MVFISIVRVKLKHSWRVYACYFLKKNVLKDLKTPCHDVVSMSSIVETASASTACKCVTTNTSARQVQMS